MCRLAGEIADGVLFNWLTPEYARLSATASAKAPRGAPADAAALRVRARRARPGGRRSAAGRGESVRGIPAYAANFARMGLKPVETAIAAESPDDPAGARQVAGVVDEVVIRAITAKDTVEEHVALVRAAAPRNALCRPPDPHPASIERRFARQSFRNTTAVMSPTPEP